MLTMLDEEKKSMIFELYNLNTGVDLIDFLRKYLPTEYKQIFQKELDVKIRITQSHIPSPFLKSEEFDVRKYSYSLLMRYLPDSLNISGNYSWLKLFKVLIFFEHILKMLRNDYGGHIAEIKKIDEHFYVYNFIKSLMSNTSCSVCHHQDALSILNIKLHQETIDNDNDHVFQDILIHQILDNYLFPFIEECYNWNAAENI
jgi:hypothetical protein